MSWVHFVTLGVALLALLCAAPFFCDRMGWRFPFAPPLPPLRIAFQPESKEIKMLQQLCVYAEAIGMLAIIQNSDRSSRSLTELLDEFDKLAIK